MRLDSRNGRRVFDDVVSIELRAIAGLTYPLVMPSYTPDAAASAITDGLTDADTTYLPTFRISGRHRAAIRRRRSGSWHKGSDSMSHTHDQSRLLTGPGGGHTHEDGTHHGASLNGAEVGIGTPAASASVALDIGGGLGALVITPSERFRSREIEISLIITTDPGSTRASMSAARKPARP